MHPLTICATPHAPDHTHTHTVPTSSASSFAPRGYLLTLTVGKVGTRRLGVADCTELVVASFVNLRVSSIKTCSVNCATAPPFQIPNGVYRQSRRHLPHLCMLSVRRGAGATPTCSVSLRRTARPRSCAAPPMLRHAPPGPVLCASWPLCTFRYCRCDAKQRLPVASGGRGYSRGAYPCLDGDEAGHSALVTLDHLPFARRVSVA